MATCMHVKLTIMEHDVMFTSCFSATSSYRAVATLVNFKILPL